MKALKKMIFEIVNFVFAVLAMLTIFFLIGFYILWQKGYVREHWPTIYCAMSKKPNHDIVIQTDTMITVIKFTKDCSCDTTYYKKR